MKKDQIVIYLVFALLAGALLVYFIFARGDQKHYSWNEDYSSASDQPYGTLYLKSLLTTYRPGGKFIFNDRKPLSDILLPHREVPADYLFVGNSFYLSSADRASLLEFVGNGNDAFIASKILPGELVNYLLDDSCETGLRYKEFSLDSVGMNFFNPSLKLPDDIFFARRIQKKVIPFEWKVLDSADVCSFGRIMTPLGFQNGGVNFFKLTYGKGAFFIHTTPLVFTNYFLAKKDHLPYTEAVLAHLTGTDIIWDEFSKLPETKPTDEFSPLYYILQQPSLRYAWWLLLTSVVLYVYFAAKRKQRVIPVLENKPNTSLEFINLISALHYRNGNPLDMARRKMRYFLYFIRSKYGIQAASFGPEHIRLLAQKSTVPEDQVKVIFDQYGAIERNAYYNSQTDKLLELFYSIENFMTSCR